MNRQSPSGVPSPCAERPRGIGWKLFLGTVALALVLAVGTIALLPWLHRQIATSPQTTYATEPLTPEGLPDYPAWYRQHHESPVPPEENALALLLQAHGWQLLPSPEREQLYRRLGVEPVPKPSAGLVPMPEPLAQALDYPESDRLRRVLHWEQRQLAPLERWLEQNARPLALAVEASHRKRLWIPLGEELPQRPRWGLGEFPMAAPGWFYPHHNPPQQWLISAALEPLMEMFQLRAMLHLRRGRPRVAWQDLLAAMRLAELQVQGLGLFDSTESAMWQARLCQQAILCLRFRPPDAELARYILEQLSPFAGQPMVHRHRLVLMRLGMLEWILQIEHQGQLDLFLADEVRLLLEDPLFSSDIPEEMEGLVDTHPDWIPVNAFSPEPFWFEKPWLEWDRNSLLQGINRTFDEMERAMALPLGEPWLLAVRRVVSDTQAQYQGRINQLLGRLSSTKRSFVMGRMLAAQLIGQGLNPLVDYKIRALHRRSLLRLAVALEGYRSRHGSYPEKLDALVPQWLPAVPRDPVNGTPARYRRTRDGYRLSLGWMGEYEAELAMPSPPGEAGQDEPAAPER